MANTVTEIVARFECHYVPNEGAPEEHSVETYLLKEGMFQPNHWASILAVKGKTVPVYGGEIPGGLGGLFISALSGDDFEGCESNEQPEVTFIVDWKFEKYLVSQRFPNGIIRLTNALRIFQGKEPYLLI